MSMGAEPRSAVDCVHSRAVVRLRVRPFVTAKIALRLVQLAVAFCERSPSGLLRWCCASCSPPPHLLLLFCWCCWCCCSRVSGCSTRERPPPGRPASGAMFHTWVANGESVNPLRPLCRRRDQTVEERPFVPGRVCQYLATKRAFGSPTLGIIAAHIWSTTLTFRNTAQPLERIVRSPIAAAEHNARSSAGTLFAFVLAFCA